MPDQKSTLHSIFTTIYNDIRSTHAYGNLKKESKAISDFYLSDEQKIRLNGMNSAKQSIFVTGWILKAMFFKLTPFRRLLFVLGLFFLLTFHTDANGASVGGNTFFGGILLVLVILLELKDKLLAHDELAEGRHIQELLMPERMPRMEGWSAWMITRSANEVCGDLIDFLRMENGRIGIVIADVAGKGLHAALLTTKLQATMRALAYGYDSLSDLIHRINTIFHRDSPAHIFASLVFCEIGEKDAVIKFVNAGHLPPIHVSNRIPKETPKGDVALGLKRTVDFSEQTITMKRGDFFVLYSDGLTEGKNEQGEFFGKDRLRTILRNDHSTPEQMGNTILREIDIFIGSVNRSDDLSLIIIRKD